MSKLTEIKNERLHEKYYSIDHDSGLKILVLPKEKFKSTYAIIGTRYGSIDTDFRLAGEEAFTHVPEGIAHYLEHKLFESEDLDAFQRYAKTGASANAYTSFDKTCYLFSCTENFKASLEILLDFVTHPYFTPETVQKEQGIIGQEIKMCQDDPDWETLFLLLRSMYKAHPVRVDIAGTVESIRDITADLLYTCYNTFYNFSNMVLCVVGNVTPEDVLEVADRVLVPARSVSIERKWCREPSAVCTPYAEKHLPVAAPIFSLGFKEEIASPERSLSEILLSNMLLEIIAGKTSPLYNTLLEDGLLNTSFYTEYFCGYGYAASIFTGETPNAKEVQKRIVERIHALQKTGIKEADFLRIQKKFYGRAVMELNDIESLANNMVAAHFCGEGPFDEIAVLERLTLDDLNQRLRSALNTENCALTVIQPEESL